MDVVGNNKSGYKLFRRRVHLPTPEVDTYQRQIVFCEKKYDIISKKFLSHDSSQDAARCRHTSRSLSTDGAACHSMSSMGSRKTSIGRHNTRWARRKSSLQLMHGSSSTRPSVVSSAIKHNTISASQVARRCSSEDAATTRVSTKLDDNNKQHHGVVEKDSEMSRKDSSKDQKEKLSESQTHPTKEDGGSTCNALEEVSSVLYKEREQFLRALTTLAINRITTDIVTPVERNSTFTNYERNIELLTSGSRLLYIDGDNNNHENEKDISSDASSATTDLYVATEDETNNRHIDKRHRINQLRNYLKCSGFGDPNVITTITEQTEEEKQALTRLIRRINRGLSGEKQERLRRKARLDYEMSLMKGESFCEQQEQAYMRTASADMGNQDVQLLEEELRIHAMQEIRQNNQKILKRQDSRRLDRRRSSSFNLLRQHQQQGNAGLGDEEVRLEDEDGGIGDGEAGDNNPSQVDEKSATTDDDRDAMSGLIRNPLSRREMRKRILLWVYDVEEATGMNSQEKIKHDSSRRRLGHRGQRKTSDATITVVANTQQLISSK